MAELIKFTGNNDDLFCRLSVDALGVQAQILVPETHTAVLIKNGQYSETLKSGVYKIFDKENGIFKEKKDSTVKSVDVVYISKTVKARMLWGTRQQMNIKDTETGVPIKMGANGEIEIRVKTPKKFYLELVGVDKQYDVNKLKDRILTRVLSAVEPAVVNLMNQGRLSYDKLSEQKAVAADMLKQELAELLDNDYGLELCSFTISGIVVSDQDIAKVEKRSREITVEDEKAKDIFNCYHCNNELNAKERYCPVCGKRQSEIRCPTCGTLADPRTKFCPVCSNKLTQSMCKKCKTYNEAGSKFCKECGHKLD